MHRCYVPPAGCAGERIVLTGGEAHHALRVLRMRRGDRLTILDGQGGELLCAVEDAQRGRLTLRVVERLAHPPPACRVSLFQALPKGKLFDAIVQKATELGVWRIVPVMTERVVSQLDVGRSEARAEHWQAVGIEAIKQSGNAWLPVVEALAPPGRWREQCQSVELALVGALHADARHPREWFLEFAARRHRPPSSIGLWIGPEGDFTPAELAALQEAGVRPISLGPRVLRVETAAVYALSVVNYELEAGKLQSTTVAGPSQASSGRPGRGTEVHGGICPDKPNAS